ncbi:cholesterol oxidase [Dulcicalothrix desertica PCC 7102]|uniref:Cholesterol oxidase n=1 Tax=Dulcicalothrix desertica PCC 7102 TaxID=232991 RepID=A0A3S1I9C1_9CYAN|nr:cholesterol oxidase [Dulcicalothrix desertica PCC 7102]
MGVLNLQKAFASGYTERVEAVVIGSGFGGAVASLRLGQAGIETVVLERGRRWEITDAGDTFCTYQKPDGRSSWLSPTTPSLLGGTPIDVYTGVLDVKVGDGITAWRGAGVGGTSLIYGGITYQPTQELFYQVFPRSIDYEELNRVYYPRVRSILKPSAIPDDILATQFYLTSRIVLEQAAKANLKARKYDMNIDWDIVRQEIAGQKVPSTIVGALFYGINSGANQSLDRNYLKMASSTGYVQIRPLHVVTEIEEADNNRFRVVCNQINEQGVVINKKTIVCRYLFLAAGSIGTTELLLRAKNTGKLRRLSEQVGKLWGNNGDALSIVATSRQTNPTQGGLVTVIEDFDNPISPVVLEQFPFPGAPEGAYVALSLALSKPEGYLKYDASKQTANLVWPKNSANNQKIQNAVLDTYQRFNQANGTSLAQPPDANTTAHPLGGATIGAVCNPYGRVHGYRNLFVVDGAFIPGSCACTNPSLTIAALAERSMDRFLNGNFKD